MGNWIVVAIAVLASVVAPASASGSGGTRDAGVLRTRDVLAGDGIGSVQFGASPHEVRMAIDALLRQAGGGYRRGGSCGLDHQITWPKEATVSGEPTLTAYFERSRWVGYQYGDYPSVVGPQRPARGTVLATTKGLGIRDTLARARRLYGRAFAISAAQGGSWSVRTPRGEISGFAYGTPKHGGVSPLSRVATIDAGDVGCPALSP